MWFPIIIQQSKHENLKKHRKYANKIQQSSQVLIDRPIRTRTPESAARRTERTGNVKRDAREHHLAKRPNNWCGGGIFPMICPELFANSL